LKDWLQKANHDLIIAKKGASEPNPVFDAALYHCQQCAEKSAKAYLLFLDTNFEKTHDIIKDYGHQGYIILTPLNN
jgi:HEPN domain-containing protein